jgi:N-acyl-D-aspartate/D-glutamate deacylase
VWDTRAEAESAVPTAGAWIRDNVADRIKLTKQFPVGIDYVIVNGVPVVDGGRVTGALPGRALRRGRRA